MIRQWLRKLRWHRHHWIIWSEVDYDLGYAFDYMKCDKPDCKWHGLTFVERTKLSHY